MVEHSKESESHHRQVTTQSAGFMSIGRILFPHEAEKYGDRDCWMARFGSAHFISPITQELQAATPLDDYNETAVEGLSHVRLLPLHPLSRSLYQTPGATYNKLPLENQTQAPELFNLDNALTRPDRDDNPDEIGDVSSFPPGTVYNPVHLTYRLGITLQELDGSYLDFTLIPTETFRFINVKALVEEQNLVIVDFPQSDFEKARATMTYFILFYPHSGMAPIVAPPNQRPQRFGLRTTSHEDDNHVDPIDVGLILHLLTQFKERPQFIWISRLCCFRTPPAFIHSQISILFEYATACLLLPEVPTARDVIKSDANVAHRLGSQLLQYLYATYHGMWRFEPKDRYERTLSSLLQVASAKRHDLVFISLPDRRFWIQNFQEPMLLDVIHPFVCWAYHHTTYKSLPWASIPPMLDALDKLKYCGKLCLKPDREIPPGHLFQSGSKHYSRRSVSIKKIKDKTLDLFFAPTSCRYRFIDCPYYIEGTLILHDSDHLPEGHYATISYPWRGNGNSDPFTPTFIVNDSTSEFADPISIDVLNVACRLAVTEGVHLIWLDRLCVSQTDKQDKMWQIHRMYDIYKKCKLCIIIPGGIWRLAHLNEETPWISRLWTLQEAVAPPKAVVLFMTHDLQYAISKVTSHLRPFTIEGVQGGSRWLPLSDIIEACERPANGVCLFNPIFSHYLRIAMSYSSATRAQHWSFNQLVALWQSAMTRSSSIPEDLLLGIMDLLSIPLQEGEKRTNSDAILHAFTRALSKDGISGDRSLSLQIALQRSIENNLTIPEQWQRYITHFVENIPLLDGGIEYSEELEDCLVGGCVFTKGTHDYFLGSALVVPEGGKQFIRPCIITALTSGKKRTFSCELAGQVHKGRWALFPFDQQTMQWILTVHGGLSYQCEPILAGYELHYGNEKGRTNDPINKTDFYFARSKIQGEVIFGRTGSIQIPAELRQETLEMTGFHYVAGEKELVSCTDFEILCWKRTQTS